MTKSTCEGCGAPIEQPHTGRRRRWCSDRCRKAHQQHAKASGVASVVSVGAAVDAVLDARDYQADDVRSALSVMARQVAAAVDATPATSSTTASVRVSTGATPSTIPAAAASGPVYR